MNEQKQATPAEELHRQFMDHSTPLTEAGHWARRRIEQLESELRRQATDLHEGEHKVSDFNEPVTEAEWWAKGRIEQLEADREKLLQLLKSASEVIGRFVSDEGWAQSDMDTMDTIDAEIAALEAEQKPMNIDELHEQGLVSRYDMISEANNYRG